MLQNKSNPENKPEVILVMGNDWRNLEELQEKTFILNDFILSLGIDTFIENMVIVKNLALYEVDASALQRKEMNAISDLDDLISTMNKMQ